MKKPLPSLFFWIAIGILWGKASFASSPNFTTIPNAAQIIDSNGGVWTVNGSNQCLLNGVPAGGGCGRNVRFLLFYNETIYDYNPQGQWYKWNGIGFTSIAADPRGSASGMMVPPAAQISDGSGGVWTIVGGGCALNGVPTEGCSQVQKLLWYNWQLYAYDSSGQWLLWNGSTWGTVASPLFDPAAAGYRLVFDGTFNAGEFDTNNTDAPGFKWYTCKQTAGTTIYPSSDFSISNGVMTISSQLGDKSNGQLCSAVPSTIPPYWTGSVFSGGWYIEYSIAFDNTTLIQGADYGWPAVWALEAAHLVPNGNEISPPAGYGWPGQEKGYSHAVENDMFEYLTGKPNGWEASLHDWYGIYNVTCGTRGGYCSVSYNFEQNEILLPSVKWTDFNTFGQLWVAGSAANGWQGSTTNYFNGMKMQGGGVAANILGATWIDQGSGTPKMITNPPIPRVPTFTFSVMDQLPLYLLLGTGSSTPMQVRWVRVWQPAATRR
jgi:hypothetical protein